MTDESIVEGGPIAFPLGGLVVRSAVATGLDYTKYRQDLRVDFYYSCAYCTMTEAEASGIRFTIDHYEPQSLRPDLAHDYDNLMYACDECNVRKGDLRPPAAAFANGHRYFRPDSDYFDQHFRPNGIRMDGISPVGNFTVDFVSLNRKSLRTIRDVRNRMADCHEAVVREVLSLRKLKIDRMPKHIKGRVASAIARIQAMQVELEEDIDDFLRQTARAEILDPDAEAAKQAAERAKTLRELKGMYPGQWRTPRPKKTAGQS